MRNLLKDYDLTHIYVDAICKVSEDYDLENLGAFLNSLDAFLKDTPVTATIIFSGDTDNLPESVKEIYLTDIDQTWSPVRLSDNAPGFLIQNQEVIQEWAY